MASKQQCKSNRRSSWDEHMRAADSESSDDSDDEEINSEGSRVPDGTSDYSDESKNDSTAETDSGDSQIPESVSDGTDESEEDSPVEATSDEESTDTSTEEETSEEELQSGRSRQTNRSVSETLVGKSGYRWTTSEPPRRKIHQASILRQRHGVGRITTGMQTLKDAFQLLFTCEMVLTIVKETNERAANDIAKWNNDHPEKFHLWKKTDRDEIWAFIGLLILGGVQRSKNEHLRELWSPANGRPIFRATMSKNRIDSLLRFCRFDDLLTREVRKKDDRLAPISELWTMLLAQLERCYIPGGSITVDEQLVTTRGRCKFRQYIPSKPGKYGIKIFWCCDSTTGYPLKGEVYLGRQLGTATSARTDLVKNLVKRLVHPWTNAGRTVTTDNYFTSVNLAEDLLGAQTTIVGTIRRNKPDIPLELQPNRQRAQYSSLFCFDRELTLVSYVPTKKKAVILLSSMHHDTVVSDDGDRKPEIISYYNETKGGVDRMNQMVQTYSCKRKTNRWPMTFFFNMLDIAGIAAFVIWLARNPNWNDGKLHRRRLFLHQLGRSLIDAHLNRRSQNKKSMQRNVKLAMQTIGLPITSSVADDASGRPKKQRCRLCTRASDRKVAVQCDHCRISCCPNHRKTVCTTCWAKV